MLAIPVGILILTSLKSPEPRSWQGLKEYLGSTWSYLRNIKVLGLFAASTITFILLYGTLLTYFTFLLSERFGASSFTIGLVITSMSLTTAAVSSQLGKINRRFSLESIIILAFFMYGVSFLLMPITPNLWLLLVPVTILGAGHGGNIPSLNTVIAGIAPLEYRAAFMSMNVTVLRFGQTIGPPLIALVYIIRGLNTTFYVSGAIVVNRSSWLHLTSSDKTCRWVNEKH